VLACIAAGCGSVPPDVDELTFVPLPDTPVASPATQITVRGAGAGQVQGLTVIGSRSGIHRGRLVNDRDAPAATFAPDTAFEPGEEVRVSFHVAGRSRQISYRFGIAQEAQVDFQAGPPAQPTRPGQVQHFHSRPDLRPPTVRVTERSSATARGDIFIGPANKLGQAGPMIVDDDGNPVWFHPLPGKLQAFGFRKQVYRGKPVLTWWQGVVSSLGYGRGEDVIYNTSYRRIATVHAADGYAADLHEFVITPQNTALITAFDPVQADLSSLGGSRQGVVLDCVLQEVDIRTGGVLFEWHSLGHVGLDESYNKPGKGQPFDYFHLNSIAVDRDGNLIISARNTWTVYKLDRRTGRILWRLGGKRSSFTLAPGTAFAYQHDAQPDPDGTITVFDNGGNPRVHPESRGIDIALDTETMTASLVHQWTHPRKLIANSQGNVQTLANGDRFIGWGGDPDLTEFSPDGRVVFDAAMADPDTSYRAYRFPWRAKAPGRPAVAVSSAGPGTATVYVSWNGATDVAAWRILAGPNAQSLIPVGQAPRTGFETRTEVVTSEPFLAAEALSRSGKVLGVSAPVARGG